MAPSIPAIPTIFHLRYKKIVLDIINKKDKFLSLVNRCTSKMHATKVHKSSQVYVLTQLTYALAYTRASQEGHRSSLYLIFLKV